MYKINVFFFCAAIFLPSISLSGCLPPRLKPQDVIGLWVEVKTPLSPPISATVCGSFKFFPDGKFEAQYIPREYFILAGISPTRINASGSWELIPPPKDPFAFQRINLKFEPFEGFPQGFESSVLVSGDGREHILVKWMGESHRITFVRDCFLNG
jgi:hypothetical protein